MHAIHYRKLLQSSFLLCFICVLLSGCDRYRLTVNERSVFEPPPLFKDHHITDPALAQCINQAIIDQHVTQPMQLSKLVCTHAGVTSLDGLPVFSGITHINLKNNHITEIKPLLFLPRLQTVNLQNNPLLNCKDALILEGQLTGELLKPEHCREVK